MISSADFLATAALQKKFPFFSKFSRNPVSIPKTYTHVLSTSDRSVTRGARGRNSPSAESLWGRETTAGGTESPKSPNSVTSTLFNTVHLLPKDLTFEHGGAKLASCPGRHVSRMES